MLAPNDPIPNSDNDTASPKNAWYAFQNAAQGLTILCVVIGLYAFLVGVSILRGALLNNVTHFLISPVPLALALWFGFGFMQSPQRVSSQQALSQRASADVELNTSPDFGLLLLCAGWGLTALALLVPSDQSNIENVTATVCGVLGMLCLVMGNVLSLRAWIDVVKS